LFCYPKDTQQLFDREARLSVHKVDNPVVGATIFATVKLAQDAVWIRGETAIGEKHQLYADQQLLVCQKAKAVFGMAWVA